MTNKKQGQTVLQIIVNLSSQGSFDTITFSIHKAEIYYSYEMIILINMIIFCMF